MSAERLREAASEMREDWPQVDGSDPEIPRFYAAVAAWLDSAAVDAQARFRSVEKFVGVGNIALDDIAVSLHALAVANAYLGSPS